MEEFNEESSDSAKKGSLMPHKHNQNINISALQNFKKNTVAISCLSTAVPTVVPLLANRARLGLVTFFHRYNKYVIKFTL